jgi:hypothetical protein
VPIDPKLAARADAREAAIVSIFKMIDAVDDECVAKVLEIVARNCAEQATAMLHAVKTPSRKA